MHIVTSTHTGALEPRDYLHVVRRRKWTILACVIVVVGAALVFSFMQTPIYEASTRVLLRPSVSVFDTGSAQQSVNPVLVQTEIQIIRGEQVRALVRERLGGDAPKVSASAVGDTSVIEVTAESRRPATAADIADAYVDAYIDFNQRQATEATLDASKEIQGRLDELQREIADLDGKLANLPSCGGANPPRECDQRQRLNQDRDALVSQVVPLRTRLNELQVGASRNSGPQVIARATVPTEPSRPQPVRNGLLGLGVGLLWGVGLAFVYERFDDSIRSKEDLERCAPDVPILGTIAAVPAWKNRSDTLVMSRSDPTSPVAEAYRSLRTSINFLGVDRPMRVIQVTSSNASEGKTTTLANLAVALARAGERVVIVNCDLRRPRVHDFFGLADSVGFTNVFLGEMPISSALQSVPGEPNLRLLASGRLPPNPSELLSSPRTEQIFAALRSQNVMVLIDCPPVLPVTDAAVLSSRVDGTLLVASAGSTNAKDMARALELLGQVGAPVIGVVLNGVDAEGGYGYQYGYLPHEPTTPDTKNWSTNGRKEATNGEEDAPAASDSGMPLAGR